MTMSPLYAIFDDAGCLDMIHSQVLKRVTWHCINNLLSESFHKVCYYGPEAEQVLLKEIACPLGSCAAVDTPLWQVSTIDLSVGIVWDMPD